MLNCLQTSFFEIKRHFSHSSNYCKRSDRYPFWQETWLPTALGSLFRIDYTEIYNDFLAAPGSLFRALLLLVRTILAEPSKFVFIASSRMSLFSLFSPRGVYTSETLVAALADFSFSISGFSPSRKGEINLRIRRWHQGLSCHARRALSSVFRWAEDTPIPNRKKSIFSHVEWFDECKQLGTFWQHLIS